MVRESFILQKAAKIIADNKKNTLKAAKQIFDLLEQNRLLDWSRLDPDYPKKEKGGSRGR